MFKKIFFSAFIIFIICSLLPILVVGFMILRDATKINEASIANIKSLGDRAIAVSDKALEDLGKNVIEQIALATAKQVDFYLKLNPKLLKNTSPKNRRALYEDKEFKKYALQPVGTRGYTALHENDGYNWVHQNPKVVGTDLHKLSSKFPSFWRIIEENLKGKNYGDYYDWPEPDGRVARKYMFCASVGSTTFRIAATTYVEEFNQPMKEIRENILTQTAQISKTAKKSLEAKGTERNLYIVFIATLIIGFFILFLITKREVAPFKDLSELLKKISTGDLNVKISDDLKNRSDEVGEIANSLERIVSSVKYMQSELSEK